MKLVYLLVFVFLVAVVPAFAQELAVADDTSPFNWYTSVAGVVAATIFGVTVLKRALGNVQYVNTVPTWVYAVLISGILTFVTNRVWGTLPGDLWQTMMQAVMMAGAASGFYDWLREPTKPLAAAAIAAGVHVSPKNAPDRIDAVALKMEADDKKEK